MSLTEWLDAIKIKTLLKFAPHGFLIGCGGTSEYLAFAIRSRPKDKDELFKINRVQEYFDSAVNEKSFVLAHMELALIEINNRLQLDGYVRVSFDIDVEDTQPKEDVQPKDVAQSILSLIHKKPDPKLFDHSFIVLKTDGIWRLESYIDQYAPRAVRWDSYSDDLKELLINPVESWERIFGVRCDNNNPTKVTIIVNQ